MKAQEVKSLLSAIDDLLDIKVIIRNSVPNYSLDSDSQHQFINLLISLEQKLFPIFSKYLNQDLKLKEQSTGGDIKEKILNLNPENSIILVSASSSKKKLKTLGIDPRIIIVSGGPLSPKDYKIINPKIPDSALINIEKKCTRLQEELHAKDWSKLTLYFIHEPENKTDQFIIEDLETLKKLIGEAPSLIPITSWNDLEV